jgi:hypothetical protein
VKKLRELSIPEDKREHLSFATFAAHCQLVFHIEANEEAWTRLEPLMDILVRGNGILRVFGPTAHLMAPSGSGKPYITETRVYQSKGRIGMAYNAVTAVYDCAEVMNYDLEVKVKMAARQKVDGSGKATDDWHTPPPLRTNVRPFAKRWRMLHLMGTGYFTRLLSLAQARMQAPHGLLSLTILGIQHVNRYSSLPSTPWQT